MAQYIRDGAGLPSDQIAGVQEGVTVGADPATATIATSRIAVTYEGVISGVADSGTGTINDPYVIENRIFNSLQTDYIRWTDTDADYHVKLKNCILYDANNELIEMNAASASWLTLENCTLYNSSNATGTVEVRYFDNRSGADPIVIAT